MSPDELLLLNRMIAKAQKIQSTSQTTRHWKEIYYSISCSRNCFV